jgi:hypothetical protein
VKGSEGWVYPSLYNNGDQYVCDVGGRVYPSTFSIIAIAYRLLAKKQKPSLLPFPYRHRDSLAQPLVMENNLDQLYLKVQLITDAG